jgi:ribosomal protein S30
MGRVLGLKPPLVPRLWPGVIWGRAARPRSVGIGFSVTHSVPAGRGAALRPARPRRPADCRPARALGRRRGPRGSLFIPLRTRKHKQQPWVRASGRARGRGAPAPPPRRRAPAHAPAPPPPPARAGKVHGSLARAGKVRGQTPKVPKQDKKKKPTGRGEGRGRRRTVAAAVRAAAAHAAGARPRCVAAGAGAVRPAQRPAACRAWRAAGECGGCGRRSLPWPLATAGRRPPCCCPRRAAGPPHAPSPARAPQWSAPARRRAPTATSSKLLAWRPGSGADERRWRDGPATPLSVDARTPDGLRAGAPVRGAGGAARTPAGRRRAL